jgi:hypothetical protein
MAKPDRMNTGPFAHLGDALPIGRDAAAVRKRVKAMEHMLERVWTIPGINRPVGADVLFGLLPVGGSFIGAAFGAYMVWEARNLGMSRFQISRMLGNVGLDWALGLIPFVGIVPDFFFRSNTRNLRIILKHLDRHHPGTVTLEG